MAVDFTGQAVEYKRIQDICKRYGLVFIEDAAHSIGTKYDEKPMYWFPYYKCLGHEKGLCPNAERVYETEMSIPLYYSLTDKDTAVDFLEAMDVRAFKIASFELVDIPLIEYTAAKGKPMLISCGMASVEEIQDAIDACRRMGNDHIVLLKCCSEYPANFADIHLANIQDMCNRFGVPIGLSDHSMGSIGAVVGASL